MYRMYSERQAKNIAFPEVKLPIYYSKDFTWTRNYMLGWNITKNLTFNYQASNVARIDEPTGMVNSKIDPEGYNHWKDSIWSNIVKFGRTVDFNHNFNASWKVPFDKIKPLDWITGNAQYSGAFNWVSAPVLGENDYGYVYDPGNTISNSRTIGGDASADFRKLYNKSKFLKSINDKFDGRTKPQMVEKTYESRVYNLKSGNRRTVNHGLGTENVTVAVVNESGQNIKAKSSVVDKNRVSVVIDSDAKAKIVVKGKVPKKDDPGLYSLKLLTRVLMMVRSGSATYTQTESSILPGFNVTPQLFGNARAGGMLAPGLDFVMGGQATDFLKRAKAYGWITGDSTMTNPFVMRKTSSMNLRLTLEPVKDLQIELTGLRNETRDLSTYDIAQGAGISQATGSFSITTITFGSAFQNYNSGDNYRSDAFERFSSYRKDIAWRVARNRQNASNGNYSPGSTEYPDGYGRTSQEALIPAFVAAYAGRSTQNVSLSPFSNIPLPNWRISYSGFGKSPLFKQAIKSGSIKHAYSSVYSINAYNWNDEFTPDHYGFGNTRNNLGNFIPLNNILNVSIRESFNPLIGVDIVWQNDLTTNVSINKNRTLGLSLANNQVLELSNLVYRIDVSYFFKKVPLIFKFGENRQKKMDTDLTLSVGMTFRNEQSFIRSFEETEQLTQISGGNRVTTVNVNADYTVYKGVKVRAFFNYDENMPWVSAITTSNIYTGFGLIVSLND
jgi:cell surface protein SprA